MNAQENANMNELLASDTMVHVMNLHGVGDLWSDDGDYRTVTGLTAAKTRNRRRTHRVTARNNTRTRTGVESKPTVRRTQTVRTS